MKMSETENNVIFNLNDSLGFQEDLEIYILELNLH